MAGMAQPGLGSISPSSGEVFIADCKGTVFLFDKSVRHWIPIGEAQICRVMLYQYGDKTFRLVARTETSEANVVLNLTLRPTMMYEVHSDRWHQLTVDIASMYGFNFMIESNPRNFAVVLQSLLKAAQVTGPPPPPLPHLYEMPGISPRISYPYIPEMHSPLYEVKPRVGQDFAARKIGQPLQSRQNKDDVYVQLADAISTGDRKTSVEIVDELVARKAKVVVCEAKRGIRKPKDLRRDLSLSVQVEDKDSSGASFKLKATPSMTVGELKQIVYKKYNLPCEVQKWIIGKKITKNEDTLVKLNVTSSGATVFLYLMSAKDVGYKHSPYTAKAELIQTRTSVQSPGVQSTTNSGNSTTVLPASTGESNPSSVESENLESANESAPASRGDPVISEEPQEEDEADIQPQGWTCPKCTFINPPTRPGCSMCSCNRPEGYAVPQDHVLDDEELERLRLEELEEMLYRQAKEEAKLQALQNYEELIEVARQTLIPNREEFDCPICYTPVEVGEGVMLRDCLHCFCRDCLVETIRNSEEAQVQCPYQDDEVACHTVITDQEVKTLLSPEDFEKFLRRSLTTAESQAPNSFHCKSPNCPGWCFYEDNVNTFNCFVCGEPNCLTCKVQHPDMDCREYQEDLKRRANNDEAAKQTQQFLEEMIQKGDALKCPQCEIVLLKKDGCDWMRCSMCKLEICWATRGPRWGPKGNGDISGGCRCRVGGKKCHPRCHNCH